MSEIGAALLLWLGLFANVWPAPGPGVPSAGGSGGLAACMDGADNDGDGLIDYPADAGCTGPTDTTESGDNTIIVGGNLTNAQLTACINGTDQGTAGSLCHARVATKLAASSVCGNATSSGLSSCNSLTQRTVTDIASGNLPNTTYNYIDFTDGWLPVKIGGGGFITGIDISPDGLARCARTDTYGAYCRDPGNTTWVQVVNAASMPATAVAPAVSQGVYEIRVAPSLSTRIYMIHEGQVYRSNDRGQHWSRTSFTQVTFVQQSDGSRGSMDANDQQAGGREGGEKMAISPTDPNLVLVGTSRNGLFRTTDGGDTWVNIASVPTTGHINGIAFGSLAVFLGTDAPGASGVYRSLNNGVSFSLVSGGPAGQGIWHGIAEGTIYFATSLDFKLWRLVGATWTDVTPPAGCGVQALALDPLSNKMAVRAEAGGLCIAPDSTAGTITFGSPFPQANESYVCPDAGWLCQAVPPSSVKLVGASLLFDPVVIDRLWLSGGVGPWFTSAAATPPNSSWTSSIVGIEQLVANTVIVPPNASGRPLAASWDFGVQELELPDTYPSDYLVPVAPHSFQAAWHLDWASSDPNFIVAFTCWTGPSRAAKSTDGGATWTELGANVPPGAETDCDSIWGIGGTGAVASSTNWIWVPSQSRAPYFTTNAGASWTKLSLPGIADQSIDYNGWASVHQSKSLNRHIVTADRVNIGTFYIATYLHGIYKSTNGGATWTNIHAPLTMGNGVSGFDNTGFNAKLVSVPGKAGNLFFTAGPLGTDPHSGHPQDSSLWRSGDGGQNWTAVTGMKEVYAVGFGGTVAAVNYPVIYAIGWYNGVYGIWSSIDNAATFQPVGTQYALDSIDQASAIDGDKSTGQVGRVYLGFRGSGYAYYTPPPSGIPQCSDGIDNDGDGAIDYPNDLGCGTPNDATEDNVPDFPIGGGTAADPQPTGWQHTGVTLTPYTGSCTISTNGTVIDSKDISTCFTLNVTANNVTIKRSRIRGNKCGDTANACLRQSGTSTGLLVEDVEVTDIDGIIPVSDRAISLRSGTLRRVWVHGTNRGIATDGCVNGPTPYQSCIVEYSKSGPFVQNSPLDHASAIKSNGGGNDTTIRYNYLECAGSACSGSAQFYQDNCGNDQYWLEGNLFNTDGGLCAQFHGSLPSCGATAFNTNFVWRSNRFGTLFNQQCGFAGPIGLDSVDPSTEWSNNRWYDPTYGKGSTLITGCASCSKAACSDGIDNDADGKVDYPADTGCTGYLDTSE